MAGVEGFEPPNAWTKTMCLTTWRHPKTLVSIPYRYLFLLGVCPAWQEVAAADPFVNLDDDNRYNERDGGSDGKITYCNWCDMQQRSEWTE